MKKLLIFLTFLLAVLIGICAWQARELSATKRRLSRAQLAVQEEQQVRADQAAASRYLERREADWKEKAMQLSALVGSLRASESAHASNYARLAQASRGPEPGQTNEASGALGGMFGKGMGEMVSKMMKDPNMREFLRAQQKAAVKKMYGPLIHDLNLPAEQQQKLTELLLDQQMQMIERSQEMFQDGKMDFQKVAESSKEAEKANETALKDLLGAEKFAEFEDYKKTIGERMQLSDFKEQLQETNWPLRDEQAKQILAVIKEERDQSPPALNEKSADDAQDIAGTFADGRMERQIQWQEELNRKVQERLASVLTHEQLKVYTDLQEQQLSMQKFGIKMAREMFGKGAPAEGTAPVAPAVVK